MSERKVSGRLVLDDRVMGGSLRIEDGWIVEVAADESAGGGPYICPGFVDLHVHGSGGFDAMGGPAALDGMARYLARRGVTSFLPTAVASPVERLLEFAQGARDWMRSPGPGGATAAGFNLEGPFLSPAKKGAQSEAFLARPEDVPWPRLEPLLPGLRVITVAPELPGALELIRRFTEAGAIVALGHSNATALEARAGYAAGARTTTHLFNAMSPVHQHSPGLAVEALADRSVAVELIADGHHVDRTLWPIVWACKPAAKVILVSDAISLAGAGEGILQLGDITVEVGRDRSTVAGTDTLAGSVISLDTAVRNVAEAGIPLPQAVAAATRNPLELIQVHDRGRLAPGQRADLVLLDGGLCVQTVLLAGKEVA
jgi:N-acetylglucosamine-6-phosphate deacetylase